MFSARSLTVTTLFFAALFPAQIFAQNVPPVVSDSIPDATYFAGAPAALVPLQGYFSDPDTTVVRLTTVLGDIDLALYDQETPLTVANFKNYIDNGRYFPIDPTTQMPAPLFFHRSVAGFVIQSGGFAGTVNPSDPEHAQPTAILPFAAVPNEPGISNTRGTIAMAKVEGNPDSATSQWFINLADNLDLDTQNGGFTVFGRVIGDGMSVADAIALVPRFNFGSPFESLPLRNYTSPNLVEPENLVSIPAINYTPELTFTASSAQPALATVSVSGTNLLITPKAVGTATITVTATDVDGAQVSQSFVVTMIANPVRVVNISTRALVGALDDALIGGFIVAGDTPKLVAVRAIGPSLGGAGIGNPLANPSLELHDGTGALIASNDNWQDAANAQDLVDLGLAPTEPNESAILTTIPASSTGLAYTAVVQGPGGSSGVGLVEVYDLDSGPGASVLNISTRSDVQTGDNVLIGGLIVTGAGSQQVLVRAIGPSLGSAGVANPLSDPTLTLFDAQGAQIDFNDNWQDNPDQAEIAASMLAPNDPSESAVLPTLAPGGYTAIVRGAGDVTGTGLVEVYVLGSL
ncbi:MAG: peptidylprolyl isomerase [Verrucomicrobiota bacterium]|nr:peptidylprolyl isomerase [Verrucomicrobiota bacterium]